MHGSPPQEIALARDRLELTVTWDPSDRVVLEAETMRLVCRCAWCRRDRILGVFPERFEGVAITHIETVGAHALHIAFSDGHKRGLYPWPYLRDIADGVENACDGQAATHLLGCQTTRREAPLSRQRSS